MRPVEQTWPEDLARDYRAKGYWRGETFPALLRARAAAHPERIALKGGGASWSYGALLQRAERFGAGLLALLGFRGAVLAMAIALALVWLLSLRLLRRDLGRAKGKPKFRDLLSKSRAINLLSAARLCLFASRDVWFVVALPVYLSAVFGWDVWSVGAFMALWVIGYGVVQARAPAVTGRGSGHQPGGRAAAGWALALAVVPALIALGLMLDGQSRWALLGGLLVFGVVFALNSALHSYLIVSWAARDAVSLDVGFYYMSNAAGRLLGTLLSGWIYQQYGLVACLWLSAVLVLAAGLISLALPEAATRPARCD